MEGGGSVLVDQAVYAKRNNSSVPPSSGYSGSNHDFMGRSASQQLLNGAGAVLWGAHPPMYASGPLPAPTYSSLPLPHLLQQPCPPLLPLPPPRSFSLPSPTPLVSARRVMSAATPRSANKDQRKPRSSPANTTRGPQRGGKRPHNEPPADNPPARAPKSAAATTWASKDEAAKEGDFTGGVYELSPPPSSLPMPSFSLRARTLPPPPSSSCNAEALGGVVPAGVGGVGARASDDLRLLLRL